MSVKKKRKKREIDYCHEVPPTEYSFTRYLFKSFVVICSLYSPEVQCGCIYI